MLSTSLTFCMKTNRKILGPIVALLFLTLAISCGEDEEVDREPLIIGTWTLESQNVANIQANVGGVPLTIPPEFISEFVDSLAIIPENSEITFNQDRTYTVKAPQQTTDASGTWSLSEDQNTITITGLAGAEALLGSSSLAFVIQRLSATDFSMLTSVPEITIPNVPNFGSVKASGDYQLSLEK